MRRPLAPLVLLSALFAGPGHAADVPEHPNIIIVLTDDQGFADLGVQGSLKDVQTPNLDKLAASGVRFTDGYVTSPQCSPSRAGIMTGRYQERFGLEQIKDLPLPLDQITMANRLSDAHYITGQVGKWHLAPEPSAKAWLQSAGLGSADPKTLDWNKLVQPYLPTSRGFQESFCGLTNVYWATHDQHGKKLASPGEWIKISDYRLDAQSDAAVSFIDRNAGKPFFLYLAYFAPHNPGEATPKYLARFPGPMPERRRYALAMISAIDDGVGRIVETLKEKGLTGKTIIFFTSDNGAPYDVIKADNPIGTDNGGWDGSLNDPMIGEKGMIAEGGIHVPMIISWPGVIPPGQVRHDPVISLDFAATSLALAGLPPVKDLDGVDLMPFLTEKDLNPPHEDLYWRFMNQTAIREGKWKYLQVGNAVRYLFDLSTPDGEGKNLLAGNEALADDLKAKLAVWAAQLKPPGIPDGPANKSERHWYNAYFNANIPAPPRAPKAKVSPTPDAATAAGSTSGE